MGLSDVLKRVMRVPTATSAEQLAEDRWQQAVAARDELACQHVAFEHAQAQRFAACLRCYEQLCQLFPERRGEWLRWMGQTLYISMHWREADPAKQRALLERALGCYFEAAPLGERSQEENVLELCELLEKPEHVSRYLELFPEGAHRERAQRLLRDLTPAGPRPS